MRIGVFSDVHDHVDNMRHTVRTFNQLSCDLVVFAGDFCSPIVVPPLRKLSCPVLACFGDNDGNQIGIRGGMRIIGEVAHPPFGFETRDGVKMLVTHLPDSLKGLTDGADVVITAHSHRPSITTDAKGRLFVNPGEAGGWMFRKPTVAVIETDPLKAEIVALPELGEPPVC